MQRQRGISILESALMLVFLTGISTLVLGLGAALRKSYWVQDSLDGLIHTYDTNPLELSSQVSGIKVADQRLDKMLQSMLYSNLAGDLGKQKRYFIEARWQAFALDASTGTLISALPVGQGSLLRSNFTPDAATLAETDLDKILGSTAGSPSTLGWYKRPSGADNQFTATQQYLPYVVVMAARAAVGLDDTLSSFVWKQSTGTDVVASASAVALRSDL